MNDGFIKDRMREVYLEGIYRRISEGKSTLIVGEYGCGKTRILDEIEPRNKKIVRVESLSTLTDLFENILRQVSRNVKVNLIKKASYLEMICEYEFCLIVDELNDLSPKLFPWFKRMMDSGISVVAAGLREPDIVAFLQNRCPDVLSRFKVVYLRPLGGDVLKESMPKWEPAAVDMLYGAVGGNLRTFFDIAQECRREAATLKSEKVTIVIVSRFV